MGLSIGAPSVGNVPGQSVNAVKAVAVPAGILAGATALGAVVGRISPRMSTMRGAMIGAMMGVTTLLLASCIDSTPEGGCRQTMLGDWVCDDTKTVERTTCYTNIFGERVCETEVPR